jgi:hypothetical protein
LATRMNQPEKTAEVVKDISQANNEWERTQFYI